MNRRKMKRIFFLFLPALLAMPVASHADPGNNYCVKPPFISAGRTPNLLMIIDNSASMYDQGYTAASSSSPPSYSCSTSGGQVTVSSSYCFDNTYDNTKDYEGYFSRYDAASTPSIIYPIYQYSGGKFVEVASIPTTTGSNIYRTSYLYVEMTGSSSVTPSTRAVSSFIASGRFLNWLSSSKFDIEKKILTGGKYDPSNQMLMGESRGCDGRRFVKVVPGVSAITFAIRGPTSAEPNYDPSTQGGDSRIEVFEATYNANDCQCAVYNWTNGSYGQASTDTKNCLGTTPANSALSTLNHSQQTCWLLKDNISKGATTDSALWQGVNTQDIKTACDNVYTNNQNPVAPNALTDESNGNFICTSVKTNHPAPIAPYDINGSDTNGYVGTCWGGGANKFTGNDACVKREILHYCMGVNFSDVTDPSSGSSTSTSSGIPSLLIDAGVRAISDPIGPSGSSDKFFYARAVTSTPPTGVIQDFSGTIRFGAMSFNYAGSSSECGGTSRIPCPKFCSVKTTKMCVSNSDCLTGEGTCQTVTNLDGGLMNAFIGDSVGNYSSGLINSINNIKATSWTPFAEAYFNAIAYFTKDATATNPSLSATKFTPTASAIAAPLTGTDSYTNQNPIQYRCQLNNILFITDGASTADINSTMTAKVTDSSGLFRNPGTTTEPATCGDYYGSPYLHDLSYFARHRNIFDPSKECPAPTGSSYTCETAQTITTHAVYTGPVSTSTTNMCDSYAQMRQTAIDGGTEVKTPSNPTALRNDLKETLQKIAAGAASGTAASILSNSEGSGANMLQAVFYPTKIFENKTVATWIGEMQNLWYYVDPYISNSTIREDTDGDLKLNLVSDYVARFAFDTTSDKTMVQLYQDSNGDSVPDTAIGGLIDPDYVKSLWRSGKLLWERNIGSSPRKIKTTLDGTSLIDFSSDTFPGGSTPDNAVTLAPYLNVADTVAPTLINWVHGQDQTGYRGRTVDIKDPATNVVSTGVWRLGDIISSTPRVQSTVRLNTYNLPPPGGYSDKTYETYTNSASYKSNGMVYVGGNDGMFHAFKLGTLSVAATGFQKAIISNPDTSTPLGHEVWAFAPKNALPYLRYMADPTYDHVYSIDGRTAIFDASIGDDGSGVVYWNQTRTESSWRTVVIGGMGLGGASRNSDSTCDDTSTGNCVKTPVSGVGYSSYFAFDVSNPNTPVLLWEFSNSELGYATSGPAIVRVGDKNKNGRWYAVFGSGPTGPIDTASHQFLGTSNQHLKFFVIDLATGSLVNTIDTGISDAFAGSMLGGSIDVDRSNSTVTGNYQDDAVYVGYVKKCIVDSGVCAGRVGSWVDGGLGRIMTTESQITSSPAASNWVWSTIANGIGPVTTSIARTQDKKNRNLWLFFGTGRFFFRNVGSLDDNSGGRSLFAIKEPCYNTTTSPGNFLDKTCSASISGSLVDQTTTIHTLNASDPGWRIDLDSASSAEGAERVVTDTVAMTNGTVFFTSFKPTTDLCGYGGNSFLWGVKYDTGDAADAKALLGKALIQLSTGEFREVDLATAFTDKGNRRMLTPMTGKPPSDAPPIISNSQNRPLKKILHIKER